MNRKDILAAIILLATTHISIAGTPLGTAFTYQGQLKSGGAPYTGTADMQFTLYDAAVAGNIVAGPIASGNVQVANGLFTTTLDFGASAFNGEARWLETAVVTPAGGGSYIPLTPRQAVTPAPYALALPGLRTSQNGASPSIIGEHGGNSVTSGILSATVSGGGNTDGPNRATDHYSTVSGGEDNQAGNGDTNLMNSGWSTVAGGTHNIAGGMYSVVSGGIQNTASGDIATAVGGYGNTASGYLGTTLGGTYNTAQGQNSTAAGSYARALHDGCFVWGDASVPFMTWFDSTDPNQFLIRAAGGVGINTTSPTSALTVQGMIESRSEGFMFPDGTVQSTAAGGGGGFTLPYAGSISLSDGPAFDIANQGAGGTALRGVAAGDFGTGVIGQSSAYMAWGVSGIADGDLGTGIYGRATGQSGSAVYGDAQGASAIGVHGVGWGANAWGGFFYASNETSDLVLGGPIGQINSAPDIDNSRLVLASKHNVTVHLDNDNNSNADFQILRSDGTNVCSVDEDGLLTADRMGCRGEFLSSNNSGLANIALNPDGAGGGAYFAMRDGSGTPRFELNAPNGALTITNGSLSVSNNAATTTVQVLGQAYGSGSQVNLKDSTSATRLQLTSSNSEVKL
ncbi:MAG: hypothetical protein GX616_24395, partial [Planctomycetes bacterium]|nr:hypothetical protein [Planctomycetota bacterium]